MYKDFKKQRNRAFWLAILIGLCYLLMLVVGTSKISSGFIMQLIFLGEYFRNPQINIFQLVLTSSFVTNVAAGVILLTLLFIAVKGFVKSLHILLKTRKFLTSLKIVKTTKDFIVFKSKNLYSFTSGFFKPKVYISEQIYKKLGENKSKAIVFHELAHKKNFDPLKDFIVNTFINCMPRFLRKNRFFINYFVLVELSCDFYSEQQLGSKKPLIKSLVDIFEHKFLFVPLNTYVKNFSAAADRIQILTGNYQFKVKNLYLPAFVFLAVMLFNIALMNKTNLLLKCSHPIECLRPVSRSNTQLVSENNHQACMISTIELKKGCPKIDS